MKIVDSIADNFLENITSLVSSFFFTSIAALVMFAFYVSGRKEKIEKTNLSKIRVQ